MDLLQRLLAVDVSALSDADKSLPVADPGVRAMVPGVRMAGPAYTVLAEDDHLPVMTALAEAAPGDVLVVATRGGRRAVFGELFATEARRRGLAGIVCDGLCRDASGIRALGLPVFTRGLSPSSPQKDGPGEIGAPVSCGGVTVSSGDVIVGDEDGVVVVPLRDLEAVGERLQVVRKKEEQMLADVEAGVLMSDAVKALFEARGVETVKMAD